MSESYAQSPDNEIVAQNIKEYVHSNLLSVPNELSIPDVVEHFHHVVLGFPGEGFDLRAYANCLVMADWSTSLSCTG